MTDPNSSLLSLIWASLRLMPNLIIVHIAVIRPVIATIRLTKTSQVILFAPMVYHHLPTIIIIAYEWTVVKFLQAKFVNWYKVSFDFMRKVRRLSWAFI